MSLILGSKPDLLTWLRSWIGLVALFLLGDFRIPWRASFGALDNIMVERLWRSVKYEETYLKGYNEKTMKEATQEFKRYFDFYNEERPHQSLKYLTPGQVYREGLKTGGKLGQNVINFKTTP